MKKVGIFDSGLGGLLILRHLIKEFPQLDFVYIADYAYNPYGRKDYLTIENRVIEIGKHLVNEGVDVIVIACNTASLHVEKLRAVVNVPVIEVISITSDYAFNKSLMKKFVVFATNKTIENGSYQNYLLNKGGQVIGVMASEWVDLIETGKINTEAGKNSVLEKVSLLNQADFDIIIMGCTHFELAKDIIFKKYPHYHIITSEIPVINELKKYIKVDEVITYGKVQLYSTVNITEDLVAKVKELKIKYCCLEKIII